MKLSWETESVKGFMIYRRERIRSSKETRTCESKAENGLIGIRGNDLFCNSVV